jgi:hypothetical protein
MNVATWTIKRLALVMACLGLLAFSTAHRAEALIHGGNADSAADAQVAACQAMGGTSTVEAPDRTVEGSPHTKVTCTGGVAGGWECQNMDTTTHCFPIGAPLPPTGDHDPSLLTDAELLDDFGGTESATGSDIGEYMENVTQQALATKTPADHSSVAALDDDQEQDTNKAKGKKGKKGKKGGKGRKK